MFSSYSNWLWIDNDWPWFLHVHKSRLVGRRCTTSGNMDSCDFHLHFHNCFYTWLSGCAMGYDWWSLPHTGKNSSLVLLHVPHTSHRYENKYSCAPLPSRCTSQHVLYAVLVFIPKTELNYGLWIPSRIILNCTVQLNRHTEIFWWCTICPKIYDPNCNFLSIQSICSYKLYVWYYFHILKNHTGLLRNKHYKFQINICVALCYHLRNNDRILTI